MQYSLQEQHEAIKKEREIIEENLFQYRKRLKDLQESCPHPNLSFVNKCDVGNYDPSSDCYWTEYYCPSCGKAWSEFK